MAATAWKLDKDLCRCCHGEGEGISTFHSLTDPVYNLGVTEVYLDMLKSCLDIELTPVIGTTMAMKICSVCVRQLREASSFKRQVQRCEEHFKEVYQQLLQVIHPSLKQEDLVVNVDVKQEMQDDDADDRFDMKFDDSDDDQPIIKIKVEDSRKAKRKSKTKTIPKAKRGRPPAPGRKNKETTEGAEQGKRGVDTKATDITERKRGRHPKFELKETDYRQEGDDYICGLCGKKFDKYIALRFHVKNKHYKVPRYVCQYCKKGFMTPAPLTVHKLEEHHLDERFKCKACNAAFNTKVQLRKHTNNYHMLGEKYKCPFCEYESFSFEGLYKHKFKHKTVKDYHCRFCKKSFLRKATLDLHERIHTGDRRKVCNVCGQAFVQKASLNYHMAKYHPEVNF